MTARERSILVGATMVLALAGMVLGLQALVGDRATTSGSGVQLADAGSTSDATGLDSTTTSTTALVTTSEAAGAAESVSGGGNDGEPPPPAPPTTSQAAVTSSPSSVTTQPTTTTSTPPTTAAAANTTPSTAPSSVAPTTATSEPTTSLPVSTSDAPPTTEATTTTAAEATTSTTLGPVGLDGIEREILRLTNALRAEPAGALARNKPMPSCVNEDFYGISIGGSGHPVPVVPLTLDEAVSVQLARAWSIEMDRTGDFRHRSNESASAVYDRLGIRWSATGENIAWFRGYPDDQAARIFFEGWRESDTGHYCAMVSPTYSHIGVGYYKGAESSWATQNFYRPR